MHANMTLSKQSEIETFMGNQFIGAMMDKYIDGMVYFSCVFLIIYIYIYTPYLECLKST